MNAAKRSYLEPEEFKTEIILIKGDEGHWDLSTSSWDFKLS